MAFIGTVRIKASKDVQKMLTELPPKVVKAHMRKALTKAARVIQAEAKLRAPVRTGQLKKQIKIRAGKTRSKWAASMKVQIVGTRSSSITSFGRRSTNVEADDDAFYGTMVESGTVERVQKSTGRNVGRVTGRFFLKGAFDDRKRAAEDIIAESLAEAVMSEQ